MPADPLPQTTERLTLTCAMSGERETLTVYPVGQFGVSFVYGEDASVIVAGFDLVQLHSLIGRQLANAERAAREPSP